MKLLRRTAAALAGIGLWSTGGASAALQPVDQVELRTARFYRSGGNTLVDAFCRVPFTLLESLGRAEQPARFNIDVTVRDSAGLAVRTFGWSHAVGAEVLRVPGASTVEHFAFAAPAGRYQVEIAVTDSASGRVARATSEVEAFGEPPRMSDILLSTAVRRGAESDTVPAAGEIRKGSMFLTAVTRPVLTPGQARLFYYVELYPGADAGIRTIARVVDRNGRQVISGPEQRVEVGAEGGVSTSGLDLTGLPPGDYRVSLEAAFPDTSVVGTAEFVMAGFDTEAAIAAWSGGAPDTLAALDERELDRLYEPLVYVLEGNERGLYPGLSVEGKRNFLRSVWARRDPTPGTPANEERDAFYARIAEANKRFREGGGGQVAGWRTDRGRIFIRYGEPAEVLRRPQSGPARPYEVWKYTSNRPQKFVFLDETGLGNYVLIFTDERREPSRPEWERLLGPEAVQDVIRF